MNQKLKAILIIATVAALLTAGVVLAATYLTSNHIAHEGELEPAPTPTPTASPTPTPTPSPTPVPSPTSVTLTANDTGIHLGDKITFTAQLDQPVADIIITYYNNSTNYGTYTTDATGAVTFTRGPFSGAYDCYVVATIP